MPSRIASISANPMIREYAQGAAQRAITPVAEFIAPSVSVASLAGKYKVYTEKHRFKIPNTKRPIGGRATQLGFSASDANYNCTPNALDFPVDMLEQAEEAAIENALMEGAAMVAEVAALAHEQNVINTALANITATADVSFSSNGVDPVDTLDQYILNVIKAAKYGGLGGVGIVFGATAWRLVKNNKNTRAVVFSGGKTDAAVTTTNLSGTLLGNPETRVTYLVQDTAVEGAAESISFLLDSKIMIFARSAAPTRRDPSFMKTFRLAGQWMVPGSYMSEDGRTEVAKMDWSEDVVVTNASAAALLTVS